MTKSKSANHLCKVVQDAVQSLRSGAEVSTVDGVCLIGDEPVGGPEHGEKKDYEWFVLDGLPQSEKLGLPGWILHQYNAGAIWSNDILRVAKEESEDGPKKHEDNESNVGSIGDCGVGLYVEVLSQRDLLKISQ